MDTIETYNKNNIGSNKILDENNLSKYKLINFAKDDKNNNNKIKNAVFKNNELIHIKNDGDELRKINAQLKFNDIKKEFRRN